MCNYTKELNAKHIDVERGRNTLNILANFMLNVLIKKGS